MSCKQKASGCCNKPNDNPSYPDDSFDNMIITSKKYGFGFPYLIDETQQIAKTMVQSAPRTLWV
ncbi:MAG: hypothetical protein CM15mP69_2070 [Ectothiorhodospiraceae bacterium]|nr:MAG: hypothetical protein CM15mP69_2070 [Ectothiorhodospiraceae bacterium]